MARPTPIDEEIELDPKRYIVSKTDATGIITYANDYFSEVAQYSNAEKMGDIIGLLRDLRQIFTHEQMRLSAIQLTVAHHHAERLRELFRFISDFAIMKRSVAWRLADAF